MYFGTGLENRLEKHRVFTNFFLIFHRPKVYHVIITEYNSQNSKKQSTGTQADRAAANFPHQTRNKILAAIFAAFAMTGYAFASGMFQVSTKAFILCL